MLLDGLADVVAFGREFERYETLPDGRVRAHFADGTSAEADLLVGADEPTSGCAASSSRTRAGSTPA